MKNKKLEQMLKEDDGLTQLRQEIIKVANNGDIMSPQDMRDAIDKVFHGGKNA